MTAPARYSFCESVAAGPRSPWHIRRLSAAGQKLSGGIDTPLLCGRVTNGWDLDVPITEHHLGHAHRTCVEAYRAEKLAEAETADHSAARRPYCVVRNAYGDCTHQECADARLEYQIMDDTETRR